MKQVYGDLINMAQAGEFDVIIHGVNCFCTMGAGIAKAIASAFPLAQIADSKTKRGDCNKLGKICIIPVKTIYNKELIVVNAYTQYHYGTYHSHKRKDQVDYNALRECFTKIKQHLSGKRFGIPAIGAGLAGGNWNKISKIIEEVMVGENITLVLLHRERNNEIS